MPPNEVRAQATTSDSTRRVGFYIRVSTERQAKVEEGSLKNQEQMLRAELSRRNSFEKQWGSFVASYVDDGVSGKTINRPAFRRLMRDIEFGRIDTVMFTELSRLSRSLKDFLSIFEFAQTHGADLICLKTEIDTTSPYQELVTKILMVFAEFEREMTSRRTSQNAYERAKRGLANGGKVLLGYRRDPVRKGQLLIDREESAVVREIYRTYLREKSVRRTTERIATRYEGSSERLKRITDSKVHTILTNKTYIGVRTINRRSKGEREEVPAAWKPIIETALFEQVQQVMAGNNDRTHRNGSGRRNYLLSGILRCGQCGQMLQGRSARAPKGKTYLYYAHKGKCPDGGHDRIEMETVDTTVLDWLSDLATGGERSERLEADGKRRLSRRIQVLQHELQRLQTEQTELEEETEDRIRELTRTDVPKVRSSIEASIVALQKRTQENSDKRLHLDRTLEELEGLSSPKKSLLQPYTTEIRSVLDAPLEQKKPGLQRLFASLILDETHIKTPLCGVYRRGPDSSAIAPAPPVGRVSNLLL